MAFLAPLVGVLATASTATTVGLMVASTAVGVYSSVRAGKAQARSLRIQADEAESASKDKQLAMLKQFRGVRSAQNVLFASRNISFNSGSAKVIGEQSELNYRLESDAEKTSTNRQVQNLNASADSAITTGYLQAGQSLFDTGVKIKTVK